MVVAVTQEQLARLGDLLVQRCGLRVGTAEHPAVIEGVARLMVQCGSPSFDAFYALAANPNAALRDRLALAMLSRETAWFREPECLALLPELVAELAPAGCVRIWSAGCSTGQEPYSVAMLFLADQPADLPGVRLSDQVEIVGTDSSPAAVFLAMAGRYEARALERETLPDGFRERFFTKEGRVYALLDHVRRSVRIRQHDLLQQRDTMAADPFHVVLLRHVLEFYTPQVQRELLAGVHAAMAPGGLLLLGRDERLSDDSAFVPEPRRSWVGYRRR